MKRALVLLLVCSSICTGAQQESTQHSQSFEQALATLQQSRPELFHTTITVQTTESSSTYHKGKQIINVLAFGSAFMRIYAAHQKIDEPTETQWFDKTISYVCPPMITRIARQSLFFKESIEIALETVILKTVAKLILFCATHDGIDAIKHTAHTVGSWFFKGTQS